MFKKILVATDLDTASKPAVAAAVRLAEEHKAQLHMVHVIPDPMTQPWAAEAYGIELPDLVDDLRRRAAQELRRWVDGIMPAPVDLRTEVLVGAPASEIVRYARDGSFDLIVIGTHGRGPIRRAFLGSVAHRVLQEASCPVLTIRHGVRGVRRVAEAA